CRVSAAIAFSVFKRLRLKAEVAFRCFASPQINFCRLLLINRIKSVKKCEAK
uniref:Uncharacterized protein n=1 Tax=Anopheles albimanus TaxID=7167 RepID=A0A182FZB9_ANOAL